MGLQIQKISYRSEIFTHYFLCHYRPMSKGLDKLSQSLLNFKSERPLDVEAWTSCALSELGKIKIPNGSLIVRVLNSDEKTSTSEMVSPMDNLGRKLASQFEGEYRPELLTKSRATTKVKYLSAMERVNELDRVYSFQLSPEKDNIKSILIIDDILTTSATICAVISAVRNVVSNCDIQLFTLASTDRESVLNNSIKLSGADYVWQNESGWMVAEGDGVSYTDLDILKSKILFNQFQ